MDDDETLDDPEELLTQAQASRRPHTDGTDPAGDKEPSSLEPVGEVMLPADPDRLASVETSSVSSHVPADGDETIDIDPALLGELRQQPAAWESDEDETIIADRSRIAGGGGEATPTPTRHGSDEGQRAREASEPSRTRRVPLWAVLCTVLLVFVALLMALST